MKKFKKLVILLSVMAVSVCGISPIYADESATEPAENEESVTDTDDLEPSDAPAENVINIRTAAYIAYALARDYEFIEDSFDYYDYNKDGIINIRDAAAIARAMSEKING
ncbi:MAG: hypothetical protein ACI4JB_03270 [Porcipelethomonas sp.]